jgi:hypothetical protein
MNGKTFLEKSGSGYPKIEAAPNSMVLYAVQALAERISSIEHRVNKLLHRRALIWESEIAKTLWNPVGVEGILHPIPVMYFYEVLLLCSVVAFKSVSPRVRQGANRPRRASSLTLVWR